MIPHEGLSKQEISK